MTGLPAVNQLIAEVCVLELWNAFEYRLPADDHFHAVPQTRNTRSGERGQLIVPLLTNTHEEWICWKGSKLWNILPLDIKCQANPVDVKKAVKAWAAMFNYYLKYHKPSFLGP